MQVFRDRADAGERLAERVRELGPGDPVVLALPRGGIPVGAVVAERLGAELDAAVVRKIAVPAFPETAVGAVTADGEAIVDDRPATGMSARAALASVRGRGAASLTLAVPVCSPDATGALEDTCDRVVCVLGPPQLRAVSLWYERFPQLGDREVQELLQRSAAL
ncbi:phosphoribosyltransferase [Streptomonospora salina]|uniref:Putative phosphoribosyl transferase n=1 Tax=Streptomonospora salina TaxID=104205 RepID=A0A841EIU5_9ACTN|nr:phosphoribosyltransferase family protein [Streptomonospora salina]MBB6001309.1 putative phosphoribosyl transferase [Streptomonospora salina]